MKHPIMLILILCASCLSDASAGKPDSILFAGQIVKIGSPKGTLFPRLSTEYNLNKIADMDQWLVYTKDSPSRFVGIILFENEKVSFINKDWGSYGEGSNQAFEVLYQALSNIAEQGNKVATINIVESKEPQESIKEIILQFSTRRFLISIIKHSDKPPSISFSELLEK
jgi:hypothetical protein